MLVILLFATFAIAAAATQAKSAVALPAVVMVSFAVLGLFAFSLVRRNVHGLPRLFRDSWDFDDLRDILRRPSAVHGESVDTPEILRGPIEVFPRQEAEEDTKMDEHALARHLTAVLATPTVERESAGPRAVSREFLAELVRESKDLQALGRLLKLDLTNYGTQLSKGLSAARNDRLAECALVLQLANERLRARVQGALAKELSPLKSRHPIDRP